MVCVYEKDGSCDHRILVYLLILLVRLLCGLVETCKISETVAGALVSNNSRSLECVAKYQQ